MNTYKSEISKEELQELPHIFFEGKIHIIRTPEETERAVKFLRKFPFLGFDTETKPSFKKGESNKVALLQLSTNDVAFLFNLTNSELSKPLVELLSDPNTIKAGAAIRDDIKALQSNKYFKPGGFIELQDEAPKLGINGISLKKMTGIILGGRISKAQQLSNWEAPELSEAQQIYAATDAWVSYKIYEDFIKNSNE